MINSLRINLILHIFISNDSFSFLSDAVDKRSHDTSGGEAYSRPQSYLEDPVSVFQNYVAGALGGKQSEVETYDRLRTLFSDLIIYRL